VHHVFVVENILGEELEKLQGKVNELN
jgi:hypothetical protein